MADTTLGRFIFDFIVNTGGLDKGLEQSTLKANDLSNTIRTLITLFDVLEIRMNNTGMSAKQTAEASELLANTNKRVSESNEDLTVALISLQEKFDALADSQKKQKEEGEKTDQQRDKQERGISSFTKKLLAMALAYVSVNKVAGGFKTSFTNTLQIAKLTTLLDLNAASVKNWMNIVEDIGGDPGGVIETFKNISTQLGEIDITGGGNQLLAAVNKLGIKIKDELGENLSPDQILINFSAALQTKDLDKEAALYIANQFGISEDLLLLINQGPEAIRASLKQAQDESLQLTDEDTARVLKLNKAISDVQQASRDLFTDIGLDNLDLAISALQTIETLLNSIRSDKDVTKIIEEDLGFTPEAVEKSVEGGIKSLTKILRSIMPESLIPTPRSAVDLNDPNMSDEQKLQLMNQTSSALPGNGGNITIDKSVSISGLNFSSPALTTGGAAVDFVAQVENIINGKFTQASETLSNSVIG